jgi:hypothetical protein
MAATTITRATWTDGASGTIVNNAILHSDVYAKIDQMFAGAGGYATFTFGGLVAAEGFGSHSFSAGGTGGHILAVRNTSAGTTNYADVRVGNDANAALASLTAFSSTYTTSGYNIANGARVLGQGAGGVAIAAGHASGAVRFFAAGTTEVGQAHVDTGGALALTCAAFDSLGAHVAVSNISTANAPAFLQSGEPGVDANTVIISNNYRMLTGGSSARINTATAGSFIRLSRGELSAVTISAAGALSLRWTVDSSGHFVPGADNTLNVGSGALRWANVYATTVNTGDLMLENGWALTESYKVGCDIDGVAVVDRYGNVQMFVDGAGRLYAREVRGLHELSWSHTTAEQRAAISRPSWAS